MATLSGISSCDESDDNIGQLQLNATSTPRGSPASQPSPVSRQNHSRSSAEGRNNTHRGLAQERPRNSSPEIAEILKIVQVIEKRMTKLEKRQDEAERKQQSEKKRKKTDTSPASNFMKRQVRAGYDRGVETGLTWNTAKGKRCTDDDNIAMMKHIETCVYGTVTNPDSQQVTAAIEVYFRSKYEDSLRNKVIHRQRQVHYSRKANKRDRRQKACLAKKSYSQQDREKYMSVLQTKYMSSEDEDAGEMVVRHLTWQSNEFRKLKKSLDKKYMSGASDRTEKQMYKRRDGTESNRPQPKMPAEHMWIVKSDV